MPRQDDEEELDTAAYFEARRRWPQACIRCGGDGNILGPSDMEIVFELCPACLEQGKCPKCAVGFTGNWQEKLSFDSVVDLSCPACGWKDGDLPVLPIRTEDAA